MALDRGKNTVAQAEQALEEAQATREKLAEEIAGLHGRRLGLADDAEEYGRNESEIARLQGEHRRVGLVVASRQKDVEEARMRAAHDEWQRVGRELEKGYAARGRVSASVTPAVEALAAAVAELEASRAKVKALEDEFAARAPADVEDWEFPPKDRYKVAWAGHSPDVVELVRKSARQPAADAAASRARRAEQERHAEARRVPQMVEQILHGDVTREQLERNFEALSEQECDQALRRAEAKLGDVEEDVRARFDHPLSLGNRNSRAANHAVEQVVGVIRERIDRLRDLTAARV